MHGVTFAFTRVHRTLPFAPSFVALLLVTLTGATGCVTRDAEPPQMPDEPRPTLAVAVDPSAWNPPGDDMRFSAPPPPAGTTKKSDQDRALKPHLVTRKKGH